MTPEETQLIVERCLSKVRPVSQTLVSLLDELDRPSVDLVEVSRRIEHDPVLTLATLRLANSAFYGFVRRIDTVRDAVVLIGTHSLRQVVVSFSVMNACGRNPNALIDLDEHWCQSLAMAVTTRIVARATGEDEHVAFTLGMLHEIGLLVLANGLGDELQPVLDLQDSQGCRLEAAEQALLGIDHYALGAKVLERWHLPSALPAAVACAAQTLVDPPEFVLADVVQLARVLAQGLNLLPPHSTRLAPVSSQTLERLGIGWDRVEELLPEIEDSCRDVIQALAS